MDTTLIVRQMCQDVLNETDIKFIGKSRGFLATEIANRASLGNFLLSPLGLEQAMRALNQVEVALLYALKLIDQSVDISFFERLFEDKRPFANYGTFTQIYQEVFKTVQTVFVRRGLLLIYLQEDLSLTKMERWRFYFPAEFWAALPPLFPTAILDSRPGQFRLDVFRAMLAMLSEATHRRQTDWRISSDGTLSFGGNPFQVQQIDDWQTAEWESGLKSASSPVDSNRLVFPSLVRIAKDAFNHLPAGHWVHPNDLEMALKVYLNQNVSGEKVCGQGWQVGYLTRLDVGGKIFYRLAPKNLALLKQRDPADYLTPLNPTTLLVNTRQIPPESLETLNLWMRFTLTEQLQLTATPNLVKLGRCSPDQFSEPLAVWLAKKLPAFKKSTQLVVNQWGKQIIHDNLYIAKVKDLSLRVKLERALSDKGLLPLSEEYIAFPVNLLTQVTKMVGAAGHVVKEFRQ